MSSGNAVSDTRTNAKWLYVFTQAPYSSAASQEGLDALLMGASFEQEVSALFMFDGVFTLKGGQQSLDGEQRVFTKAFQALEDFGVERCYALKQSLDGRGLSPDDLTVALELLDVEQVSQLIAQHDKVLTF